MQPLPEMYGKNLTFKTGGVDGCDCAEILRLIEAGKIDTTPLITHRYKLGRFSEEAKHAWRDAHWEEDLLRAYDTGRKMAKR